MVAIEVPEVNYTDYSNRQLDRYHNHRFPRGRE